MLAETGRGESGAGGVPVNTGQLQRNPAEVIMQLHQVGRQAGGAPHPDR